MDKIHKSKSSSYNVLKETLCGKSCYYMDTSYLWKKVTCKNCLRKKNAK
jgi:hypothetical protein